MSLTTEELMRMPWTIKGPTLRRPTDGSEEWWDILVEELPDFFVAGDTRDQVIEEYPDALYSFLATYAHPEELPPVPIAVLWRWLASLTQPTATAGNPQSSTNVDVWGTKPA